MIKNSSKVSHSWHFPVNIHYLFIAIQTKENLDKKKKKLTDFQRKVFYEAVYYKGLENYCGAMMRLSVALGAKYVFKNDENDEKLAARFALRVKPMEHILFTWLPDYEEFKKIRDELISMDVMKF